MYQYYSWIGEKVIASLKYIIFLDLFIFRIVEAVQNIPETGKLESVLQVLRRCADYHLITVGHFSNTNGLKMEKK